MSWWPYKWMARFIEGERRDMDHADALWDNDLWDAQQHDPLCKCPRCQDGIPKPSSHHSPQGGDTLRSSNVSDHESAPVENQQGLTTRNVTRKVANEGEVLNNTMILGGGDGLVSRPRERWCHSSTCTDDDCPEHRAIPDQGDKVDADALGCRMCGAARGQPHVGCILR